MHGMNIKDIQVFFNNQNKNTNSGI